MILEPRSKNKTILILIALAFLVIGIGVFISRSNKDNANQYPSENNQQVKGDSLNVDSLKYISALDWPPKLQIINEAFSCTEAGNSTERAGATEMRTINGRNYCVTEVVQGAAGSIYTQYAYAYEKDGKTNILTFSLRFSQCGNYDEPSKSECENERQTFNPDDLLDQYARTL
jgi:hypothetical protein